MQTIRNYGAHSADRAGTDIPHHACVWQAVFNRPVTGRDRDFSATPMLAFRKYASLLGAAVLIPLAITFAGATECRAAEPPEPRRIVSINLAADELVLQLAEAGNIAALSHLASDPRLSRLADRAAAFPSTSTAVEEILMLEPDIVFGSQYTPRITAELLERLGIEFVALPVATNIDECRELVLSVAEILGVQKRGEALVADMDRRFAELQQRVAERSIRPTALSYLQGGYTQGAESLLHHIMEAAGLRNHAESLGIRGEASLPLEKLILSPPDFLILLPFHDDDPTLGNMLVRHRALRQLSGRMYRIEIPLAWTINGNNLTVDTAEYLFEQTDAILREREGEEQ